MTISKISKQCSMICCLLTIFTFFNCSPSSGIRITVHNISNQPLKFVSVHVNNSAYLAGQITPGERKSVHHATSGESTVKIEIEDAVEGKKLLDVYNNIKLADKSNLYIRLNADSVSDAVIE